MPFDTDAAIAAWLRPLDNDPAFLEGDVEELETHLRDHVERLVEDGTSPEEAFRIASSRLGKIYDVKHEYEKVRWLKHKHRRNVWQALGREASMLQNYMVIALRTLRRQKGFTAINIAGLSIGLACCLLIGLYVYHESTYDRFHERAGAIYRLVYAVAEGPEAPRPPFDAFHGWGSAAPGPLMAEEFLEIETVVRFSGGHSLLLGYEGLSYQEENYYYVDSTVFDVFSFELLRGSPATALDGPNKIVLSESAAEKYFPGIDPIGQTLVANNDRPLSVTGIMADLPSRTHFEIDMLISMSTFEQMAPDYMFQNWGYIDFYTYVQMRRGQNIENVRAQMPDFIERNRNNVNEDKPNSYFLDFEPLADIYLSPIQDRTHIGPTGNPANLRIFSIVGVFILLIACINFMNLSTARSMERAREVGVRKVLGSERRSLIYQFLAESVLVSLFALVLAGGWVFSAAPLFKQLSGISFPFEILFTPATLGLIIAFTVTIGLLAGCYPAVALSAFRPVRVLKGAFKRSRRGIALRRGLVVSQFAITVILLVSTLIVRDQVHFMQSQRLGFAGNQQLLLDFSNDQAVLNQFESLKRTWQEHPAVYSAAATRSIPGGYRPGATTFIETAAGNMQDHTFDVFEVDYGFIEHLDLEMAAGRAYSRAFASDTTSALIINEAAARLYGYADPAEIVGKRFNQWGRQGSVIGIVKDFHHQSLHQRIGPLSFRLAPANTGYFVLHVDTRNMNQTLAELEAIWQERIPHRPFLYSFLDERFDAQYQAERRFGGLFGTFAGLALFVACLGLIGTTTYATQQRTKEIGVRKVLGASVWRIVALLSREVVLLILFALAIAFPLAYFGMSAWMNTFPFRATLNLGLFLLAGGIVLVIAFLSVGQQTFRAATADPVKSLRYE